MNDVCLFCYAKLLLCAYILPCCIKAFYQESIAKILMLLDAGLVVVGMSGQRLWSHRVLWGDDTLQRADTRVCAYDFASLIRIELPTTKRELRLIASAATSGLTYPMTAKGTAMTLYSIDDPRFCLTARNVRRLMV